MVNPKYSRCIVGIDLGTSNCTASVYKNGQAEIVPLEGKPVLPSVIHVNELGEFVVGTIAKQKLLIDPSNTIASVKRDLGNPEFEKSFDGLPGKTYSATELSSEILKKIVSELNASDIDLGGEVKNAVICIPANFDDIKKHATIEAGKMAGLEVVRLLEEPVAAAISYAADAKRDQRILVYDLGGGTFDVSILNVDSTENGISKFKVLAKEGITDLGGDDFDRAIMQIVAKDFKLNTDLDIFDLKRDQGINRKTLRQAQQKLKEVSEVAKIELSQAETSEIIVPNFLKDETGVVHNIEYEITKSEFENSIRDLIRKSQATMEKAMQSANLSIDDISRIILVGGSTKVPLVKHLVTEMFDREPYCDLDPSTVVARGAAQMGAALMATEDNSTSTVKLGDTPEAIEIIDMVTHYLGIEVKNGRFDKILDKGAEIPVNAGLRKNKEYTTQRDYMAEIRISVYQALDEPEFVTDSGSRCIGEFYLSGIPPKKKGEVKLDVKFEISQQNLLTVTASAKDASGVKNSLEIKRN